jgi:hypothetical protein
MHDFLHLAVTALLKGRTERWHHHVLLETWMKNRQPQNDTQLFWPNFFSCTLQINEMRTFAWYFSLLTITEETLQISAWNLILREVINIHKFTLRVGSLCVYNCKHGADEILWSLVQPNRLRICTQQTYCKNQREGNNNVIISKYGRLKSVQPIPQWPRDLRRGSAAARLLVLWVRIPPGACMSVSY